MADYPLHQLGTLEFEHLSQALLMAEFGAAAVKVFGVGRDGGRELTSRARLAVDATSQWTGYTVAQAKFNARPAHPSANAQWLRGHINKELKDWTDPKKGRNPKPDNLLFLTNVTLSAVPGHGLDSVETVFEEFSSDLPLENFAIWHFDHMCRLLDKHQGVRAAFAGLLTTGDVLTQISNFFLGDVVDVGAVMRRHASKELVAEQWVRLGNSGSSTNEKLQLSQVGVDLRAQRMRAASGIPTKSDVVGVIEHVIAVGNSVLRPSLREGRSPHLVLVGGPGQGKTTIGQLICQIYRAALIDDLSSVGPAAAVVESLRSNLKRGGVVGPKMKRWPLRVDLSRYADILGGNSEISLLRFLSEQITDRGAERVTAYQLRAWLGSWPWLLVLDGFDEVVAPTVRDAMIDRINDLLVDAAEVNADLLVIATTRPQGYSAEFSADQYDHLRMMPLDRSQAIAFATRLADVRLADDPDGHRNLLERISEAADNSLTSRLMITPLQVTIMSLLLESRARVPQYRFGLFDAYYQTIYNREVSKTTSTAKLLEQHRGTVDEVHARVGLQLQVDSEDAGTADAAMHQDRVEEIAREILDKQEFPEEQARTLAGQISAAATRRLVLLVPKHQDDVGFDVRSLQEFMAARSITSGSDGDIVSRMRRLALSSHWRNTWLLAAGRVAAHRGHLVDDILRILDEVDGNSYLGICLAPTAYLALDLLDDKFAAPSPRVERLLLNKAIEVLNKPPTGATEAAAVTLQRVSLEGGSLAGAFIADAARVSFSADPPRKITAVIAMQVWAVGTGSLATMARQRLGRNISKALGPGHDEAFMNHFSAPLPREIGVSGSVGRSTLKSHLSPTEERLANLPDADVKPLLSLLAVLESCRVNHFGETRIASIKESPKVPVDVAENALRRDGVDEYFAEKLMSLEVDDWAIASALTDLFRRWIQRRSVGHELEGSR